MTVKGIRILDKKNRIVCVELTDILKEIPNGESFHWSILHFYATGQLEEWKSILVFTKEINESEKGLYITWNELSLLANRSLEIIDILIMGSTDENLLRRYEKDQEMYETCDIVIEMVDSGYWEVFSKDEQLITRLASKFKEIKFLEPDFEK